MQSRAAPWHAHALFAVLLCTMTAATFLTGREIATLLATAASTLVVAAQLATRRLRERAWLPVLVGFGFLLADAVDGVAQVTFQGRPQPTGLVAHIALPVGYAALLAGAVMLVSAPGRRNPGAVIDAALVSLSCAVLAWALLLQPHLTAVGADAGRSVSAVVVVLLIGGALGALMRTWLARGMRHGALGYIVLAVAAAYAGSITKVLGWTPADTRTPWWIALFWAVGSSALAAAAVHPTANTVVAPPVDDRLTPARLVGLGLALVVVPSVTVVQELSGAHADVRLLIVAATIGIPLVLVRVGLLARLHDEAQARLAHLAGHDELTGLPNRRAGTARLVEVLDRVAAGTSPGVVVAFADLDDFKSVNDGLGHPVGDRLLAAASMRLQSHLRTSDMVARFGGDEFLVVCEGEPARVELRIREAFELALAEPFDIDGRTLECRASLGVVAVARGVAARVDEVLSTADAAMYRHKGRPARTLPSPAG